MRYLITEQDDGKFEIVVFNIQGEQIGAALYCTRDGLYEYISIISSTQAVVA